MFTTIIPLSLRMALRHCIAGAVFSGVVMQVSAASHDLAFDGDPLASQIHIDAKHYASGNTDLTDQIFRDGLGREVVFRGWNVSGAAKLVETGFKPFKNSADASIALNDMGAQTGANVLRFPMPWEAVNPAPNLIDQNYLAQVVAQMRIAIQNRMYILIDSHQDLYSRHLFNQNSWHTGNGAPKYVIRNGNLGAEYCGVICATWAQHQLTDGAVRQSMNDFWYNNIVNGIHVQDAYIWQLQTSLQYIKAHLTAAEFNYILGVDSWNEPFDGGMGGVSAKNWENTYLWQVHNRVRSAMDAAGWADKPVFAELLVYWNSETVFAPATGGYNVVNKPGNRFVFNAHYYDQSRMGPFYISVVGAGEYFDNVDQIRSAARNWSSPAFVSEFGMALGGIGAKDGNRSRNAVYQALDGSGVAGTPKEHYAAAYASVVSSTEWQWDYYANRHAEFKNFNPSKLQTGGDAWNDENFSITAYVNGNLQYNIDSRIARRVYPRRSQGDIMQFYYNNLAQDAWSNVMAWASVNPVGFNTEYLKDHQFVLMVWRGRNSEAPTEIFIPATFNAADLVAISDNAIRTWSAPDTQPANSLNEILLLQDIGRSNPSVAGKRLLIWTDPMAGEDNTTWHYALVLKRNANDGYTGSVLSNLQQQLNNTIKTRHASPILLH